MINLQVVIIEFLEITSHSNIFKLNPVLCFILSRICSFVSSSKGLNMVESASRKNNGIENYSLSKFTITLCSTLSYFLYGPMTPKPIWALEHGSTVWPKASTFTRPRFLVQTRKSYQPKFRVIQEAQRIDSLAYYLRAGVQSFGRATICRFNSAIDKVASRASLRQFNRATICTPGNALGNIAVKHISLSGNHFQSHSHLNAHL